MFSASSLCAALGVLVLHGTPSVATAGSRAQSAGEGVATPPRRPAPMVVPPERSERRIKAAQADLASLRRLLRRFDFEDAERFPREMPEDWFRILTSRTGRPGFPDFGAIRLAEGTAHEGKWSLAFECDGGSMAAALPPGVVRIFPGSRYRLSVWVRTQGLQRAAARLVVRLYGPDGRPTGVEFDTPPIRSEGEWTQLRLDLPDMPADAADIGFELEVVQPNVLHPDAPRPTGDDVRATVWFDDLEIWQVPSIRFESTRPAQLYRADEVPAVEVELRDLVSDSLTAQIRVSDLDGQEVHIERIGVPGVGGLLRFSLPAIAVPGWYRAELLVEGDGVVIAQRWLDISVIDADRAARPHTEAPRFGLILPPAGDAELELFRMLIVELDPDLAIVPTWQGSFDPARTMSRVASIRPIVDAMLDRRIEPILAIESVPAAFASSRHLDSWQALTFFGSDDEQARAMIEPWLLAFGQHVERWQVGSLATPAAQGDPEVDRAVRLHAMLDESVAGPVLLLPMTAEREFTSLPAGLAGHMRASWSIRPGTAAEHAAGWRDRFGLVSFELAPREELSERSRVEDLAMRTLDAWREGATSLAVDLPWRPADGAAERPASLLPEALAWRQLGKSLASRSFAGEILTSPGAHCWIARGESSSALVLWSESGPQTVELVASNGAVRVMDVFGKSWTAEPRTRGQRFELTGLPIIVEGINAELALLQASARLDPTTLESRRGGQEISLVLRNPFGTSMSGTIAFVDQPDWEIAPRQQSFTAAPHSEVRIPLRVTLPRATTLGPKTLAADVEFSAGTTGRVRVVARAMVDWPDIEIVRSWRFARSVETGSIDVVVTVVVTNRSDRPFDLEAFALARDFPQNRRAIRRLAPGQSAVRTFQFTDGARRLSGATIFVGVNNLDGDHRVSTSLVIPAFLPQRRETSAAVSEP